MQRKVYVPLTCLNQFPTKGSLGRNSRKVPGGRNRSRDPRGRLLTGLVFVTFSAGFFTYTRTRSPVVAPPKVSPALLYGSLIKEMSHGPFYRPILWRRFLSCGSLFSEMSVWNELAKQGSTIDLVNLTHKHIAVQLQPFLSHLSPKRQVNINIMT